MLGQAPVRRIENLIFFMHAPSAGADGLGAEAFENPLQGFDVADPEFDFGFVGHGELV